MFVNMTAAVAKTRSGSKSETTRIHFLPVRTDSIRARLEELRSLLRDAVDQGNVQKCVELEGLMAEHVEFLRKLINIEADPEKVVELQGILAEFGSHETPRGPPISNPAEQKGLLLAFFLLHVSTRAL